MINRKEKKRVSTHPSLEICSLESCQNSEYSLCKIIASQKNFPVTFLKIFVFQVFDPVSLTDNIRASSSEREASWSNWSIRTLFGIGITSACPMATESSILIDESLAQ